MTAKAKAPEIKCVRTGCKRATSNMAGWVYVDDAPPLLEHWAGGWMCPQCWNSFQKLMEANNGEHTVDSTH